MESSPGVGSPKLFASDIRGSQRIVRMLIRSTRSMLAGYDSQQSIITVGRLSALWNVIWKINAVRHGGWTGLI